MEQNKPQEQDTEIDTIEELEFDDMKELTFINQVRAWSMTIAEAIDAWRMAPRAIVMGYGYVTYEVIKWYMNIPLVYAETNCKLVDAQRVCDITNVLTPTTQQAALVTAVISAAAVVIGFYVNSGRDWHKPLFKWFNKPEDFKTPTGK